MEQLTIPSPFSQCLYLKIALQKKNKQCSFGWIKVLSGYTRLTTRLDYYPDMIPGFAYYPWFINLFLFIQVHNHRVHQSCYILKILSQEGIKCFQRALDVSSLCIFGHWGIALCHGPNYNTKAMSRDSFPSAKEAFKHAQMVSVLLNGRIYICIYVVW